MSNTICAISTPYGSGGIAVVRVSGEQAIAIAIMLKGGMSVDGVSCLLNIAPAKVALASLILRAMGVIY